MLEVQVARTIRVLDYGHTGRLAHHFTPPRCRKYLGFTLAALWQSFVRGENNSDKVEFLGK